MLGARCCLGCECFDSNFQSRACERVRMRRGVSVYAREGRSAGALACAGLQCVCEVL